jgi:cell division protein ZapA (FtsZ GTPase activity inhibitor)
MNEAKKYSVEIFGDLYALVSDEAEERIVKAAQIVDSLMRAIAKQSGSQNSKRIAVLTALQIGSLLLKSESLCDTFQQKHLDLVRLLEGM